MKTTIRSIVSTSSKIRLLLLAAVLAGASKASAEIKWDFGISQKETYDSNVYLIDTSVLGNRDSMVSTTKLSAGMTLLPAAGSNTKFTFSYSPEITTFHSEPTEDYVRHVLAGTVSTKLGKWTLDNTAALTITDGSHFGPTFIGAVQGYPTLTGTAMRDRRDAVIFRDSISARYDYDRLFVRPVANLYSQDFGMDHLATKGYVNYADRTEAAAGIDFGYAPAPVKMKDTYVTIGYRFGHQTQEAFLGNRFHYNSDFQRVLLGIEGKPLQWMKFAFQAGPDFRHFGPDVASDFKRDRVEVFIDGSMTLNPSKDDDVIFSARKFTQPGSTGRGEYSDSTYAVLYKHRQGKNWTWGGGFTVYGGSCEPANRRDYVYTTSLNLGYVVNPNCSLEGMYSYEFAESQTPSTDGHEYDRHAVGLGIKFQF